jgi:hypothetical protein
MTIGFARSICRYYWINTLKQTPSQKDWPKSFVFFGIIQLTLNTLILKHWTSFKNTFGVTIIPPTTQRLTVFAGITICFIKSFIKIMNHRGRRNYFHICIIITIIIIIIHLLSSLANFFCYNHHLISSSDIIIWHHHHHHHQLLIIYKNSRLIIILSALIIYLNESFISQSIIPAYAIR